MRTAGSLFRRICRPAVVWGLMVVFVSAGGCGSSVRLVGEVVDEKGDLLDGVTVEIAKKFPVSVGKYREEKTRVAVDGALDVSARGEIVTFSFAKDGYYTERIKLFPSDRVLTAQTLGKYIGKDGKLTIELLKKGRTTTLKEAVFTLECRADGSLTAADLSPVLRDEEPRLVRVASSHAKEMPTMGIYASVGRATGQWDLDNAASIRPHSKEVILAVSDAKGGVVRAQRKGDRTNMVAFREAAERGYARETAIPLTEISDQWFYFNVGGKYGRGCITGTEVSKDRQSVRVELMIEIQPDGTRNLEVGE